MAISIAWVAYGPSITIPVYKIPSDSFLTPLGAFDGRLKHRGWNFISLVDQAFARHSGLLLMNGTGACATVGLFFLAVWAGFSHRAAFIAATLFTFVPMRLFIDGPGTTGSYLATVMWSVAFSILLATRPSRELLYLAIFSWACAILIRGEVIFLALFFLMTAWLRLSPEQRRTLPWGRGCAAAILLIAPDLIIGSQYAFGGHRLLTRSDVSIDNFLHNLKTYGWAFINGRAHSVALSLFALFGYLHLVVTHRQGGPTTGRQRAAGLPVFLGGWFLVSAVTYLSMWLQIYAESKQFYPKMAVLLFFYPPYLLSAAAGIEALTERFAERTRGAISIGVTCLIVILQLPHYQELIAISQRQAQPSLYSLARTFIGLDRFLVGCYRDSDLLDPIPAEKVLNSAPDVAALRDQVRLYLVEEVLPSDNPSRLDSCHQAIASILASEKPILVRSGFVDPIKYNIYLLSNH